jgi:complement component 1 Q subcomponent-binding protein
VLLRRRDASEEVLVSAVLAPLRFEGEEPLPRDALMKVFVSKPDVKPVMRFDCRAFADEGDGGSADYDVTNACYHPFAGDAGEDKYEGPEFR